MFSPRVTFQVRTRVAIVLASGLSVALPSVAQADSFFDRIVSIPVNENLPEDSEPLTETSAEIIAVAEDGNSLVYSDSPLGGIGLIDISDENAPTPSGFIGLEGEPTAVTLLKGKAVVALNTSDSFTSPSGELVVVSLPNGGIEVRCYLGGQPDSIAVAPDGSFLAVAIENERDEDLDDGVIPQLPAGQVELYRVADGAPVCDSVIVADVTGLASVGGEDPEPEFVDINADGLVAVTLQENNHIAIIDGNTGEIVSHFSAGTVDLANVDLSEEGALTFDGTQPDRAREPDAVQWLDESRLVVANEGDYEGGSRGFTIFSIEGEVVFESGLDFEYTVAEAGHYPEARSGNKGVEPEGLEVGTFNGETYIFVLAERSSVIGVYRDTGGDPEFVQLLPTAVGPEGAVAIPSRGLLAVANEADLGEDGGPRSHVTLYQQGAVSASYPMLVSGRDDADRPIGWGALSGLAADPAESGKLYAVNDSFYSMQPTIFTIDATVTPARITDALRVTRSGMPAQLLDLEGVVSDGEGGFWLASEGRSDRLIPHALYHVDSDGEIQTQVPFPEALIAVEQRFGAEGITMIGDTLWVALQRPWRDDPENTVKLIAYNTEDESWSGVAYPLETADTGWVGLSEITAHGDSVYILERDNQIGASAKIKRLYSIDLASVAPVELEVGASLPVVEKTLVRDLLVDMRAMGGYVVDKVEGFAIDAGGNAFAVTDNDGVDDSNGETLFLRLNLDGNS